MVILVFTFKIHPLELRPPSVRLGCLTRIKQLPLGRTRWSFLDMDLDRAALGLYQQVIPLKPGVGPPAGRIPDRNNTQIVMIQRKNNKKKTSVSSL